MASVFPPILDMPKQNPFFFSNMFMVSISILKSLLYLDYCDDGRFIFHLLNDTVKHYPHFINLHYTKDKRKGLSWT